MSNLASRAVALPALTPRTIALRALLLAAISVALSLVPLRALGAGASSYGVILHDGTTVVARTRPLIALGKVSFLDATNRIKTLPASLVNIEATRSKLGPATPTRVYNDGNLKSSNGSIQVVGETPAADGETGEASGSGVDDESMTHADRLRASIAKLDAEMKPLGPRDRRRTVMITRQNELRQELARVMSPPRES